MSSFRSTQPKWIDSLAQHTLILMETTRLKYNVVFIDLTWLLGVQMDNIYYERIPLSKNIEYRVHISFVFLLQFKTWNDNNSQLLIKWDESHACPHARNVCGVGTAHNKTTYDSNPP